MPLAAGSQLGPYEIQSAAGTGGTGEAYTARDSRLERTVDIEVLPSHWVAEPVLRERFETEAKAVAQLQHPNIRILHDIGRERLAADDASGETADTEISFLVLEHLEGETVEERLARAATGTKKRPAFRVDETLAIAIQMADALDKAHQKGLIHRNLKPRSVFLTRGVGKSAPPVAKLLDLGLAEPMMTGSVAADAALAGAAAAGSLQSILPTEEHETVQSAIVGSIDYLAPEQLEGRPADGRTDIFALGVVLYEMLTGKKAFEGKSRAVLMAAIMTAEPDPLLAAQPMVSPALDHVLKRCLAKDPDDRWQTAHDLLLQLRWIAGSDPATPAAAGRQRWVIQATVAAAVVMGAALATPLALYFRDVPDTAPFQFRTPVIGLTSSEISVSPDGTMLAFAARPNQQQPASIFVRAVGSITSTRLAQTDDPTHLFWSPDSRYIAFVSGGKLKKIATIGGAPQEIARVDAFAGGTWSPDGTVIFGSTKGLLAVSSEGGTPAPASALDKGETGHFWPHFLPDGRHFLYQAWSSDRALRALFVGTLGEKNRSRLMMAETNVAYADPGYLVFHREATLFARPFDAETQQFTGDAVQITGGIGYDASSGRGEFAVSRRDVLLYFQADGGGGGGQVGRAAAVPNMQLAFVSNTGQMISPAGDAAIAADFDLSHDGRLIAVTRAEGTSADIWVIDWRNAGNATRLTRDPADDLNPVWSHDDTKVAFTSYRKGNADVYVTNANALGDDVPLLESSANEIVEAWSHDGRYIAYLQGQDNFLDIWVLPLFGDRKPFPLVQGRYQKDEPQFSYDGKWLAYTSNESGAFEVYVISMTRDKKQKVSVGGGGQPRWRADGRELYYRSTLDARVMVVSLTLSDAGIDNGVPVQQLTAQVNADMTRSPTRHQLAVTPDGKQFLLRVPPVANQGRGGAAQQAFTVWDPVTRQGGGRGNLTFNAGFGAGRGNAAGAAGLTVIRNWSSLADGRK
jgi:eukaryotic-like serine/threonine-protein kinase